MPIYMGVFDKPKVLSKILRGSVTAKGYEGWIELQSAALGTTLSSATAGTGGQSKTTASEIVVSKLMDGTTEVLSRPSSWRTAKLVAIAHVRRATPTLTMVLRDTVVTFRSVSGRGDSATNEPVEIITLNFSQITYNDLDTSPDVTRQSLQQLNDQWSDPS
jgi:type VI protein secretion system component Hcp